ncbi:MAG: hypothetical protein A3C53_08285 [Omnitrophica WOR_2 bacterium RIFCSPHIGHO2_02_FULL_68_15]|nr:MAG: hypothetical protein A3C53_08285 [Omnitrophica WOR_2 bacterium RIFCSPHIGHO2_02_FULL_68_15]
MLVSAAVGYWVVTQAEHQKAGVKKLGQYLGIAIILVSVIGVACKVYCITSCPPGGAMGKSAMCPMTGKPMGGGS